MITKKIVRMSTPFKYLRAYPSTTLPGGRKIIGSVPKDAVIDDYNEVVIGSAGGFSGRWARIVYDGKMGWIALQDDVVLADMITPESYPYREIPLPETRLTPEERSIYATWLRWLADVVESAENVDGA